MLPAKYEWPLIREVQEFEIISEFHYHYYYSQSFSSFYNSRCDVCAKDLSLTMSVKLAKQTLKLQVG